MKYKTKHKIITYTVFVIMILVAIPFTDGVFDSWKDSFMILYPFSMSWLWLRLAGFLNFKK